ncbi:MAG: hypothetical protein VKJ06_06985 [Vampirovibrionales bacterium]|nr:hypothetical protein [Vampirovibrionales bacterium]
MMINSQLSANVGSKASVLPRFGSLSKLNAEDKKIIKLGGQLEKVVQEQAALSSQIRTVKKSWQRSPLRLINGVGIVSSSAVLAIGYMFSNPVSQVFGSVTLLLNLFPVEMSRREAKQKAFSLKQSEGQRLQDKAKTIADRIIQLDNQSTENKYKNL